MKRIWTEHKSPTHQWTLTVWTTTGTIRYDAEWKVLLTTRADPEQRYVIPAEGGGIYAATLEGAKATCEVLVRMGEL